MIDTGIATAFRQKHAQLAEHQALHTGHLQEFKRELEALCKLTGYEFEQAYQMPDTYVIADYENSVKVRGTLVELANALL